MKPVASKEWAMFLRIPPPNTADQAPALDPSFLAAKGIYEGAETVLRLLRDEVLPVVRGMQKRLGLVSFHFLIHDRQSGVPTTEDDKAAYIHMRLQFKKPQKLIGVKLWTFVHPIEPGQTSIGGVDLSLVKAKRRGRDVERVKNFNKLIDKQSALILDFIEAHDWSGRDAEMLMQTRQWLHYLANQTQMKLIG